MRRFATLLFTLILGICLMAKASTADVDHTTPTPFTPLQSSAKPLPAQPEITVSLATPEQSRHTLLAGQPGVSFYVAMENHATQTRTLLAENCSWGYEMIGFEAMDVNGNLYAVTRVPRAWHKNVPSPLPIQPGETVLRSVELGNGTWEGLPAMAPGKTMSLKLRAILQIKSEFPLIERGFWFGRMVSNWVTFTYTRP